MSFFWNVLIVIGGFTVLYFILDVTKIVLFMLASNISKRGKK